MKHLARSRAAIVSTGAAATLAAIAGTVGRPAAIGSLVAAIVVVAVLAAVLDWRRSVIGLLLYLPISGLVTIALYPNTAPGALAKDVLFVVPAYIGYALQLRNRRERFSLPALPTAAVVGLVILVLVQMANPHVPKPLVALIGARTWLLYIPMVFLGADLVRDRGDLERVLLVIAAGAVVPCVIGVVEAGLIYTGHSGTVYAAYGPAASAVTQGFAQVPAGSSLLNRIPSTFTFATQYYSFTAAATAIAYALWRVRLQRRGRGTAGVALLVLVVVAGMSSGARSAFLLIPGLLLCAVVLDFGVAGWARRAGMALVVALAGVLAVSALVGAGAGGLLINVLSHGLGQFREVFITGVGHGLRSTVFGLGTGVDTIASRYALSPTVLFQVVGGTWQESWWVKALLELGVAGLLLAVTLMVGIVIHAIRTTLRTHDPELRAVCAAITAYLLWAFVSHFKAQSLDLDPENVYFWLFIGLLIRIRTLDRAPTPTSAPAWETKPQGEAATA